MMVDWNDLVAMTSQMSSNIPVQEYDPYGKYPICRNIKGKGWTVVRKGTHCSICSRVFDYSRAQVPGHSWCEECKHTLEKSIL